MATVTSTLALALVLAGCGDLEGFGGPVPPLATFRVEATGDLDAVRVPGATDEKLHAAMVWGAQWLPEPLCFLPAESAEVQAVIDAGCRDPLGFVPDRIGVIVPLELGVTTELSVFDLPSADVMVGDVTARIAYASILVFDDRNGDGRLELNRSRNDLDPPDQPPMVRDIVYGASFISMTQPDVRVALREGGYNARAAFYPRSGCGEPAPGFSVLGAGGFSEAEAISSTLAGQLPRQDPATCSERTPDEAVISIPVQAPGPISEVRCTGRRGDSSVRYREPPLEMPDLTNRVAACAKVPDFGTGDAEGIIQYIVSTRSDDACKQVLHFSLRGCDEDVSCELPEWDITATPPAWWPCPVNTGR